MAQLSGRLSLLGVLGAVALVTGARGASGPPSGCRVLLVPGAFGAGTGGAGDFVGSAEYFKDYLRFFERKGCQARIAQFPADSTIEERAMLLKDHVQRLSQAGPQAPGPVAIVAHSQGGLDARYALQALHLGAVSHLVTVGTPHRGTRLANWAIDHRDRKSWLAWTLRVLGSYDLESLRFLPQMTPEFLEKHREKFEAVPGVRYGSAVARCQSSCYWPLRLLASWSKLGAGDGMIPAESQSFGASLGEYDLDHLSTIAADSTKAGERERLLDRIWVFLTESR